MGLPPTDFESVASAIPPLGPTDGREIYSDVMARKRVGAQLLRPYPTTPRAALLDPPAARTSANWRTPGSFALPSTKSSPVLALHPQLTHPLHEPLAHLLVARLLDRREIARHLAILILLELEHLRAPGLHPIHQFAHAIGVRGDPGLHLVLERPTTLHLLLHRRAPASAEPLLGGTQLGRLVLRQAQVLLHPARERRLDLRPQPPRFVRIARLLRPEHRRHNDREAK